MTYDSAFPKNKQVVVCGPEDGTAIVRLYGISRLLHQQCIGCHLQADLQAEFEDVVEARQLSLRHDPCSRRSANQAPFIADYRAQQLEFREVKGAGVGTHARFCSGLPPARASSLSASAADEISIFILDAIHPKDPKGSE